VKKIEMIISPSKLEDAKQLFWHPWIAGLVVSEVEGHSGRKGRTEVYRGAEYVVDPVSELKIEVVIPDELLHRVIRDLEHWVKAGKIGDGKIVITEVDEAVRVRTGERGEGAL
jgi:nitrogen regulatory protein P-II 1